MYHADKSVLLSSLFGEGPSTLCVEFFVGFDCHKKCIGIHDFYINLSIEHVIL